MVDEITLKDKKDWMKRVETVLRSGMKYCFIPMLTEDGSRYPEFDEDQFSPADGSPGFIDLVIGEIHDEIKRAFYHAYCAGVCDTIADVNMDTISQGKVEGVSALLQVDMDLSKIGSCRQWELYDK